jgi:RNA polymerase sigma factor (sigma-70 family)
MVDTDDSRVSDETLIGRIAAGDPSSFDRLVRRHQAAVYRFARAAVSGETGGAEEILHETFRAARRAAHRHRDEPSARPWLLALARQAIGRRKAPSPEADLTPLRELARSAGWGSSGDELFGEDGRNVGWDMEAAFAALPTADREILTLCDREYFTVDETARVTGLADAAVHTRLHRARLRLLARAGPPAGERALEAERVAAGLHCGEVLADLTEHLDGRLSRDRAQRLDEHLEECAGCRRFESEVTAVVRALRELPDEALPPEVEESLIDALRTGEAAPMIKSEDG